MNGGKYTGGERSFLCTVFVLNYDGVIAFVWGYYQNTLHGVCDTSADSKLLFI